MVNYKKTYCKFFGYAISNDEWISSEISDARAIDIHHIFYKGSGGRKTFVHEGKTYEIDCIENLIALTRDEHVIAHDPSHSEHKTKSELWEIHRLKIEARLRVSESRMQ